jgi:hypothetical protein
LLLADGREAYLLQACERHWAARAVRKVRAATGACLIRSDWDWLARGLEGQGGDRFDFASALGRPRPDQQTSQDRCLRAQSQLEHHIGQIDGAFFRRLLRSQSESLLPSRARGAGLDRSELVTGASIVVRLSDDPADLPVFWCAFGTPAASVYVPVSIAGELPAGLVDPEGRGCELWRKLLLWQGSSRRDARLLATLRAGLAGLQARLDLATREFALEAAVLHRRGEEHDLTRLATSFMQHNLERFEEMEASVRGPVAPSPARSHPPRSPDPDGGRASLQFSDR